MDRELFDKRKLSKLLEFLEAKDVKFQYDLQKKQHDYYGKDSKPLLKVRMPLDVAYLEKNNKVTFLAIKNYILVLIRSGIAAVGYFENYSNADHKVFRAYMVRKKQGKSQIKYLKTKGKSRAGSRVRLAETMAFFEEINQRLNTYFDRNNIDEIGMSYAETLIPYFYGSKISPPFEKRDPRIFKIPIHIQNPTYETLLKTNDYLLKAEIKYNEAGKIIWKDFLNEQIMGEPEEGPNEDW